MKSFQEAVENRRSIYALGKENRVSKEKINDLVNFAVLHTPSAFNSQSARIVVLHDTDSSKLWNLTRGVLRKIVPADAFESTEAKLTSFDSGYGTILFFEDQNVVNDLMKNFPLYKDNFPVWSLESNGMLQFVIWTSLATEGIGASLQHYNPLIDADVKKTWDIPESWKLLAEMPFGTIAAPAGDKEYIPTVERVRIFG